MKILMISLITLLVTQLITITHADTTTCFNNCTNAETYTPGSPYQINLSNLLNNLITQSSSTGFYNTSLGQTLAQVYGMYLCRGDQGSTGCSACVSQASKTILNVCSSNDRAMVWFDNCMLGFSNQPFSPYTPSRVVYNPKSVPMNETRAFAKTLNKTMKDLAREVAKNSMKYGTKVGNITMTESLFTMGQCDPNISAKECSKCLKIAIAQLPYKYGARVLLPTCNIRYEFGQFYGDAVNSSFLLPGTPTTKVAMSPMAAATSPMTTPSEAHYISPHLNIFCVFGLFIFMSLYSN